MEMGPYDRNIPALIRRKRAQLMVHSYIYYKMNDNIWSDVLWDKTALELVKLQSCYTEPIGFYDALFKDFDGSTGYHLAEAPFASKMANDLMYRNPHVRELQMRKSDQVY